MARLLLPCSSISTDNGKIVMSIAIVSALSSTASQTTANIAVGSDGASLSPDLGLGLGLDFASLLFEQLNTAEAGAGLVFAMSPESTTENRGNRDADNDMASDLQSLPEPLDLLAALAQTPLEQRGEVALPEETASLPANLVEASPKSPVEASAPADGRLMQEDVFQTKPAPASEPAAKFAAFLEAAPGEQKAAIRESAGLSVTTPGTPIASAASVPAPVHAGDASPAVMVSTPLRDPGWNDDFAQKVSWIAGQRHQSAELTLNPPAMGSIEVSIRFDNDKSTAVATFVSGNAEVRETIETALPRLREMLAGVGIELGQANVSAESFRQAAENRQNPDRDTSRVKDDMAILTSDSSTDQIVVPTVGRGRGLVDMFV
ncbi:MAG: flagellar hook-length control protein FliK [Candidatus Accumulibacter sp.]|jgi:flagellar hook-length control protein FliK|nr:flagellar hook-length control protein FliK [Accumulibacter sp.]